MIKKRKKLFVKLGVLLSVIALAFTFVMVKPKAYTYSNNIIYSDNAIDFINPEKIISSNEYLFNNMEYYDEMSYMFNYNSGYSFSAFQVSLYSNDYDSNFITTLYTSTTISNIYNAINVSQFAGKSLSELQTTYKNYRIRFLVRSSNGQDYQYSYLQFNCGDMFNYLAQFMDVNTTWSYCIVTCAWDAQHVGQDRTWCYVFSQLGFYLQSTPTHSNYNYYGSNGEYRNIWNDSVYLQQQDVITSLRYQINSLQQTINSLNEQVSNQYGWKSLFFAMADTPFKTVSNFLGFDVLGINLFNVLIGFITLLACLWVVKKIIK